jgi:hypothetical protein
MELVPWTQLCCSQSSTGTIADPMSCQFSDMNWDILQAIFKWNSPSVDCCNCAMYCPLGISWWLSRSISQRWASSISWWEVATCSSRSNENEGLSDKVVNIKGKTLQRNFTCCPSMSFISPHLSNIGLFFKCREGYFNGIETLLELTYLKRGFRI